MSPATATISLKEAALSFVQLASAGRVREAYDRFVGPSFRHHNPHFQGDAESLAAGMEQNAAQHPDKIFEVKHVLEDGDFVALHGRARLTPGGNEIAVCHLYRFADGKIVELWDIAQPEPVNSPNEHGMF